MGSDLRAHSAEARRLFALADSITCLPVTTLSENGPIEALTATEVAQPAIVTTSLAALAVLGEELPRLEAAAVAGHSVGECAAYVAAGAMYPETALRFVHERASAMAAACAGIDGRMAAVIGLDEGPLQLACASASHNGSSVEVANYNAPGNMIVSGSRDAVDRMSKAARQAGARRVLPLNVGGPFHSTYMRPAAEALQLALRDLPISGPRIPVVLSATAQPSVDPAELREELAVQVYSPVRWIETLQRLASMGCDRFLEVGPGQVLAGLVRRTLAHVKVASFGSMADLDAAARLVS